MYQLGTFAVRVGTLRLARLRDLVNIISRMRASTVSAFGFT